MYTEERAREMFDKVQECPGCGGYHSANSPRFCHGCATGRAQDGRSNGHHPNA